MSVTEPWTLAQASAKDRSDKALRAKLDLVIWYVTEVLRISAILLQPIMPDKMAELLDSLGVAPDRRTFQDAVLGAGGVYGTDEAPPTWQKYKRSQASMATLFPPKASIDGDQPGLKGNKTRGNAMDNVLKELVEGRIG